MKALKALFGLLVVIIIIGVAVPIDFRSGYFAYYSGRFAESRANLGGAVQHYKTAHLAMADNAHFFRAYTRALNDLAEFTDDQSDFVEAEALCEEWLDENEGSPDEWMIKVQLARAYWGQGSKNAGKAEIDAAISLMPTDYDALVYQGIMWRDTATDPNKIALSIPIFESAVAARRSTRCAWAHYEKAIAFWKLKNERKALNSIAQALSQFPPRELRNDAERLKAEIQSGGRSEG